MCIIKKSVKIIKPSLEGRKFGKWTVLEKVIKKRSNGWNSTYYRCECECGSRQIIGGYRLPTGETTQCRKCLGKSKRSKNSPHWVGYGDLTGNHFGAYRTGAKKRNLPFTISIDYAWSVFIKQNRKCAITGLSIDMRERNYEDKSGCGIKSVGTASMDRVDSTIGYVEGNIQWVHKTVNAMKWDIEQSYFIDFCRKICEWKFKNYKVDAIIDPYLESMASDKNSREISTLDCLTGHRVGNWMVGEKTQIIYGKTKKYHNNRAYKCKCICGHEQKLLHHELVNKRRNKCCKNCAYKLFRGPGSPHFKGHKGITGDYWKTIKINAKHRNLKIETTMEDCWNLFLKQGGKCNLTGIAIVMKQNCYDTEWTASLDRIDSSKGYINGNVQWIHKDINRMKLDFTHDEFLNWCFLIAKGMSK